MKKINWGIIGCGDVTEVKSGPAFNKVPNSSLVAVMRRDAEKAKDYAERHNVPKWYSEANDLINDPDINAIYVATPPLPHEEYTIAALQAGKPVYVEKPMSVNRKAGERMAGAAKQTGQKLSVAHYRREQPLFKKVKELIDSDTIGNIRFIDLKYVAPAPTDAELRIPKVSWRVDPAIAGGGFFHDLAPHQLDLMLYFFGPVKTAKGIAANQGMLYNADDVVAGNFLFDNNIIFNGLWCFNAAEEEAMDRCVIIGSEGRISFEVFGEYAIKIIKGGKTEVLTFEKLQHVQQPMIKKVVEYFLDEGPNPCSGREGVDVMRLMEDFTKQ